PPGDVDAEEAAAAWQVARARHHLGGAAGEDEPGQRRTGHGRATSRSRFMASSAWRDAGAQSSGSAARCHAPMMPRLELTSTPVPSDRAPATASAAVAPWAP